MKEKQPAEPEYRLLEDLPSNQPCVKHKNQNLLEVHHDPNWEASFVAGDMVRYICMVCGSFRVYQILPEKTLLNHNSN